VYALCFRVSSNVKRISCFSFFHVLIAVGTRNSNTDVCSSITPLSPYYHPLPTSHLLPTLLPPHPPPAHPSRPVLSATACSRSFFLLPNFSPTFTLSLSLSPSLSRLAFASCLHYAMEDNRNSRKGTCDFVIRAKPRAEPHHCDERRTYLISRRTLILPPLREENARSVRYRRSAPPAR